MNGSKMIGLGDQAKETPTELPVVLLFSLGSAFTEEDTL